MATGKIALVDDAGYITRIAPPSNSTGANKEIVAAAENGNPVAAFQAADAVADSDVVTKNQWRRAGISKVASSALINTSAVTIDNTLLTKNFAVVTYTGNGATQSIITGINSVDFTVAGNGSGYWLDRTVNQVKDDAGNVVASGTCDWGTNKGVSKVHIKSRTTADSNSIVDGIRGVNKRIFTDMTAAEDSNPDKVSSFNIDGVTVVYDNDTTVNSNADSFILYQTLYTHIKWGMTSQGKFQLEAYNPVTKEGMIYYIGSGNAGHEISHSIGVEIEVRDIKNLTSVVDWRSNNKGTNNGQYMQINTEVHALNNEYVIWENTKEHTVIDGLAGVGTLDSEYILYYKAKSETFTTGTYIGTGASGNFIETKDVNGVARKPSRVIIKSIDVVGSWCVQDTTRGDGAFTKLDISDAEIIDTSNTVSISINGFAPDLNSGFYNALGVEYLYLVEFDTKDTGTPDGSYFDYPTDDTNLTITDGRFNWTDGMDDRGYKLSSKSITSLNANGKGVDFYGANDGLQWIGLKDTVDTTLPISLTNGLILESKKPSYGMYDKQSADDNRLVQVDGEWYRDTGVELLSGGNFDTQADVDLWTPTSGGSIALLNNTLNVTGSSTNFDYNRTIQVEAGQEYIYEYTMILGTSVGARLTIGTTPTSYDIIYNAGSNLNGSYSAKFIAPITGTVYVNGYNNNTAGTTYSVDSISIFKIEPTLSAIPETPISFIKHPIMITSETPQTIDYNQELVENVMTTLDVQKLYAKELIVTDGFDLGQKWIDETANRAIGTTYTNTNGKPIMLSIYGYWAGSTATDCYVHIDGVRIARQNSNDAVAQVGGIQITITSGSTYSVSGIDSAIKWYELK